MVHLYLVIQQSLSQPHENPNQLSHTVPYFYMFEYKPISFAVTSLGRAIVPAGHFLVERGLNDNRSEVAFLENETRSFISTLCRVQASESAPPPNR